MESKDEQTIEPKVEASNAGMPKKKLLLIILIPTIIVIVVVAVVVGVVVGTKKEKKEEDLIVNSYDNTAELLEKFPVGNPTTVKDGIEEKI